MTFKVSIIVVNYNGLAWLQNLIPQLLKLRNIDFQLILVDNNSTDKSLELLRSLRDVILIENKFNLGFSRANNQGAKIAQGDWLLFLNNDVDFTTNTWVSELVKEAEEGNFDLYGPRMLLTDGHDQLPSEKHLSVDILGEPGLGHYPFYVEGCALLANVMSFQKLGGFDETMFMYAEDIDLSWTARLMGMRLGLSRKVTLIHHGGGSSTSTRNPSQHLGIAHVVPLFRRREVIKNSLRNIITHYEFRSLVWAIPLFLLLHLTEALFFLLVGQMKLSKALLDSIWWNCRHLKNSLRKRRRIQRSRTVTDKEILHLMIKQLNTLVAFKKIGFPTLKE